MLYAYSILPPPLVYFCQEKSPFINLDIYFKIHQNNTIENEMDAWLMFLGTDDPDRILQLLDQYPWFEDLYRDLYTACRNTERVMGMFSEELKILDRNTVQYMIDEMEEQIKEQGRQLKEKELQLESQKNQIKDQKNQLERQKSILTNLCRSLVSECQSRGDSRETAVQLLCEKAGMDEATAARTTDKYWKA